MPDNGSLYYSSGGGTAVTTQSFANDAAYVAANGTALVGNIYYNTTLAAERVFVNGAWQTILTTAASTPTVQKFTSTGTTTGYMFTCSSANAVIGTTYTNNGNTYTVLATIAPATQLFCSGASAPTSSGTLAIAVGTGDLTITFSAAVALATYTKPANVFYLRARLVGGGGGGCSNSSSGGVGNPGTTTAFVNTVSLVSQGGLGGPGTLNGAVGGAAAFSGTGVAGIAVAGGGSSPGENGITGNVMSGSGGSSAFGGAGIGVNAGNPGGNAAINSGSGGGGGAATNGSGPGGSSGGFIDVLITSLLATYFYCVGTGGGGGSGIEGGGNGAAGQIIIEEYYR